MIVLLQLPQNHSTPLKLDLKDKVKEQSNSWEHVAPSLVTAGLYMLDEIL